MHIIKKHKSLKKELNLLDVYAITTGATLSGGFFILPGLAAAEAGSALILAYLLVAIPLFPAVFSLVEMSTAMPRAGGLYYFVDRSLGPGMGTVGGIGTWLALILKTAFALIGMGAYIALFVHQISIIPVAIVFAVAIGILNLISVKGSGKFQILLVAGLLIVLVLFMVMGITNVNTEYLKGIFSVSTGNLFATTGLVYVSYAGITKVVSLSEEVKDPERNLPMGIFLGLITAYIIYAVGTYVMVGVVPIDALANDLTPAATAAGNLWGQAGIILITAAALLAFISVANAGTLSASRYPFAMSRDYIMPHFFKRLNKKGIPFVSILITVAAVILVLLFFDPMKIAKLASAFQLIMFALASFAVIVMRESKLESYDPGYKSPFYPWTQIIGILSALILIVEMGWMPIGFTVGLFLIGILWFYIYARKKIKRSGAIYHVFERLGRQRYSGLDTELRGILKEKGLRAEDPFDEIVARSLVIDIDERTEFEIIAEKAAAWLSNLVPFSAEQIKKEFMDGTRIGMTPVTHGIALPHLRIQGLEQPEMVLVRSKNGVHITVNGPLTNHQDEEHIVNALFFLVSPENNSTQHLRMLAQIAGRVDDESFSDEWIAANNEQELKESLLHDDRSISLVLSRGESSEKLIGKMLKDIKFPEGCLVALLHRDRQTIAPKGNLVFEEKDRLTFIGDSKGLKEIKKQFPEAK